MGFLNHLGDTANDFCNDKNKKTITPEHTVQAMRALGLDTYLQQILGLPKPKAGTKLNLDTL